MVKDAPLALTRRFPGLAGRLPHVPLTTLPTPVHPLAHLARATGILARAHTSPYRGRPLLFWNTFSAIAPTGPHARLPAPEELPAAFRQFFARP